MRNTTTRSNSPHAPFGLSECASSAESPMPSFMCTPTIPTRLRALMTREVADKYQVHKLTLHRSGLYEYDPVNRETTKLRSGMRLLLRAAQEVAANSPDGAMRHQAKRARGSKRLQWASRASQ